MLRIIVCLCCLFFLYGCANLQTNSVEPCHDFKGERIKQHNKKSSYCVLGKQYQVLSSSKNYQENGIASWYGRKFHRLRTSSGERYNMYKMTAAHKTLPINTYVQVTNLKNGRKVIVKVNDRGPFKPHRIIDVSYAAAKKLGMVGNGTVPVSVKAVSGKKARA